MSTNLRTHNSKSVVIPSHDALDLHATLWAAERPKAVLLIAHGVGEHGGCYAELASSIRTAMPELEVLAIDFRGHGKSAGPRGFVNTYDDLIGDLSAAFRWIVEQRPSLPVFLLGHSNGGQVALKFALEHPDSISGLLISNPAIRLALRIPAWKLFTGRILRRFAPRVTLKGTLHPELLTRDPAQWPDRLADDLRHSRVSAPLFFGMVEGGETLNDEVHRLRIPLLLILGTADPIIDPGATLELFEKVGSADKQSKLYADSLHEPLNDLDRARVLEDILSWLRERIPT